MTLLKVMRVHEQKANNNNFFAKAKVWKGYKQVDVAILMDQIMECWLYLWPITNLAFWFILHRYIYSLLKAYPLTYILATQGVDLRFFLLKRVFYLWRVATGLFPRTRPLKLLFALGTRKRSDCRPTLPLTAEVQSGQLTLAALWLVYLTEGPSSFPSPGTAQPQVEGVKPKLKLRVFVWHLNTHQQSNLWRNKESLALHLCCKIQSFCGTLQCFETQCSLPSFNDLCLPRANTCFCGEKKIAMCSNSN